MKRNIINAVPQCVAITQLGTVRDCLLTVPLAVDIKRTWPETTVCWIAESPVMPLLASHACIDRLICLEPGWLRRPQEWKKIRKLLNELCIDFTVDPLGLTKSAMLSLFTGAKWRVGFTSPTAREIAPWLSTHRVASRHRHRIDSIRELLSPWNEVEAGVAEFLMPTYPEAAHRVETFLQGCGLCGPEGWFVIHPGAIWPTARWPVERFAKLAAEVYQRHGLRSVIIWNGEEERLHSEVIRENCEEVATVAPQLSFTETLELLRCSQFLLCGDSLPLQMASSIRVPCLSLHGPTWADEFGAYGEPHVAVQSPSPLLSRKMSRRGPSIAMQAIEVEEVHYGIVRLLGRIRRKVYSVNAA